MKKREYSTSISAAMDDFKEFSKSLIEEFKVEGDKLLAEKINELKESAAEDSPKKPATNKAECMQTTGQEEMQTSPQSDYVGVGSEMNAVDALNSDLETKLEAEQERHNLFSSNNDGENEEIEDAELEGLSRLDGPRKSRRTLKEPAWMKDFTTVGKNKEKIKGAESEDHPTLGGSRKSGRTAKKPAWMKDFKTG